MFKKLSAALLVSSLPMAASAQLIVGADYAMVDWEDISVGALVGSIGYEFPLQNEGHSIIAGGRYGLGVGNDSTFYEGGSNEVELDSYMALEAAYQYEFDTNWYAQGTLVWADQELEQTVSSETLSFSSSVSSSGIGIGIGGGFKFSENLGAEVSFETYDDTDYLAVGIRGRY